ncbi:DUF3263 domain-containing protein [Paenarthrobacter nicotinovorans]|uniref:DUF3263 domain-containing protein n=1 Tax=Paenarthrobacter nicotinovorans TaxID=29320 RepID=UPI00374A7433
MLTDQQKAMIDLAGEQFKYAGSLDTAAMERFGMTPTRYWQAINQDSVTKNERRRRVDRHPTIMPSNARDRSTPSCR